MKREVRSFWYPTWLAQPAALVEGSKLIDAPPHDLSFEDIVPELKNRDLVVMHTSTPSFKSDVKTAELIKAINPAVKIGFIGAKVVEMLLEYGYTNLRCFVRPSSKLDRLKQILEKYGAGKTAEIVAGDLLSRDDCRHAAEGVSVIYHLAAGMERYLREKNK